MKRTKRRTDDDDNNVLSLLLRAFVNGFLLKMLEKLGEKIGEWCAYRLIQHHDPEYYGNEATTYENPDPDQPSEPRSE